jgi:hypothetical protein
MAPSSEEPKTVQAQTRPSVTETLERVIRECDPRRNLFGEITTDSEHRLDTERAIRELAERAMEESRPWIPPLREAMNYLPGSAGSAFQDDALNAYDSIDHRFTDIERDITEIQMLDGRVEKLEKQVMSLIECVKSWDGTGFTARDRCIIDISKLEEPVVERPKPKRRIEIE